MTSVNSFLKAIFATKISPILGFGAICFLSISISALIIFTYSDPAQFLPGIQTANAEIIVPPVLVPEQQEAAEKEIIVSLQDQTLRYMEGNRIIGEFKISSGLSRTPTPPGEYTVLKKKPAVNYRGPGYNFPNTKWNLMFKAGNPLNYYIHGAFWHNNFGHPMSHGCINVAYADMEGLYNWADEGTKIIIQNESQSIVRNSNHRPAKLGLVQGATVTNQIISGHAQLLVSPMADEQKVSAIPGQAIGGPKDSFIGSSMAQTELMINIKKLLDKLQQAVIK